METNTKKATNDANQYDAKDNITCTYTLHRDRVGQFTKKKTVCNTTYSIIVSIYAAFIFFIIPVQCAQ